MLQLRRHRRRTPRYFSLPAPLQGPESLEARTLLNASALADPTGLSVNMSQYSSTDILVQFKQGIHPTAVLAGTSIGQQLNLVTGLYQVNLSSSVTAAAAVSAYAANPNVSLAELDYYLSTSVVPNDPLFTQQWDLNNTGQTGGTPGADISAEQAWNVSTGGSPITVALMDTGIDYNHPDLYQNIWINQAEIPQSRMKNLVDVYHDGFISWRDLNNPINIGPGKITDLNGDGRIDAADILTPMVLNAQGQDTGQGGWAYPGNTQDGDTTHPNDFFGWNFVANNNNPYDDNGHGTHVGGTIAAAGNNGTGIAGIDWTAQIMPVKFLDSTGSGTISNFIEGLNYAVAHGAKISNNSWQGAPNDPLLYSAIQNAQTHGQIFVVAAGNSGTNSDTTPEYPASFNLNNIVSVAATDSNNQLASFSNYGPNTISLAAPGVNTLSTLPNNSYGTLSGTSMAAPHVTGALALVWSLHPTWTYQQVIAQAENTVDKLPSLQGKLVTGGELDLAAAVDVQAPTGTASIINSYPSGANGTFNSVVVVFNQAMNPGTFGAANVTLTGPNGNTVAATSVTAQANTGNTVFSINVPSQTLAGNYLLKVSGVQDSQGKLMQAYQTSFANAGSSSPTLPTVGSASVINSYPYGPTGTVNGVVVVFNQAMNPSTFGTGNVTLIRPDGTTVGATSVTVQATSGNKSFTVAVPSQTQGGTYTLKVSGVQDSQGNLMQPYQTPFQNAGSSQPSSTPSVGAARIINSYPYGPSGTVNGVVVVFNQAMNPSTFGTGNVTLIRPDGSSVAATGVQASSGNTVFTVAVPSQTQGGTYTLKVSGVEDSQGSLMQPYQTPFQSSGSSPTSPSNPSVGSAAIINSYPYGPYGTVNGVVVVFNQAMNPGTFGTGNITLVRPDGSTVAATGVQASSGNTVFTVAVPTQTQGGTYTLKVSGVEDSQGSLMKPYQTPFQNAGSSAPAPTNPSTPSMGSVRIINSYPYGPSGTVNGVVVVFNQAMSSSSFGTGNVTLIRPDGTTIAATSVNVQPSTGSTVFTVAVPSQTQGGTYTLKVSGVKDSQGNLMQPYQTPFQNSGAASAAIASSAPSSKPAAKTFTASTPVAISSNSLAVSSLNVGQDLTIGHVQVTLNLKSPQDSDLYIYLTPPQGPAIVLSSNQGGNGQNFTGTVFDSQAATSLSAGQAPFTGTYRPDGSLEALDSSDAKGTWKLWVQDLSGKAQGTITSWSLSITPQSAA